MEGDFIQEHEKSFEYLEAVRNLEPSSRKIFTKQYIEAECSDRTRGPAPDFPKDLEWFNTTDPLYLRCQLLNKVVVLDFFTYCCINCMHILPDLQLLEETHNDEDGLVVIGVHSAKFENEKVSANILNAVIRYGIKHPVVNDSDASLWNQLSISCWPTLVILGPFNEVLLILSGEGNKDILFEFVDTALEFFKGKTQISHKPVTISPGMHLKAKSVLSYPGKVTTNGKFIAISDTGHHRILITDIDGIIQFIVGHGKVGFVNGNFQECRFNSPQGICFYGDHTLFVADTGNHAVRQVSLTERTVSTLVGNGTPGTEFAGGSEGINQSISSPWDLCFGKAPDTDPKDLLFIAMAGTHQIWVVFLEDCVWMNRGEYKRGICLAVAGNGTEENRNNSYPLKASFAQPSGLAYGRLGADSEEHCLFIADSESSSIRSMSLKNGAVKNVVGGDIDPKNLFAYGDCDDTGVKAKLQHPLGVSFRHDENELVIADSYNHKIKRVKVPTRQCQTVEAFTVMDQTGPVLNEPGGICIHPDGDSLYIADTNNHKIKVYSLQSGSIRDLEVKDRLDKKRDAPDLSSKDSSNRILADQICVIPGGVINITLQPDLRPGVHLTAEAPSRWQASLQDDDDVTWFQSKARGDLSTDKVNIELLIPVPLTSTKCSIMSVIYYCTDDGVCKIQKFLHEIPIQVNSSGNKAAQSTIHYRL